VDIAASSYGYIWPYYGFLASSLQHNPSAADILAFESESCVEDAQAGAGLHHPAPGEVQEADEVRLLYSGAINATSGK
jgi:hypothetical protein